MIKSIKSFFSKKAMNRFYIAKSIYSFAESLISLFLPFYFYNLHFSLSSIFLFFAVNSLFHTILMLPATHLCHKYGFVKVFISGITAYILFYIGIYILGDKLDRGSLYSLACLYGVGSALFWTGYHFYITWHSNINQNWKELSTLKIASSIFSSLWPLFGWLIIMYINFQILFAIAAIIMFISVLPLINVERMLINKPPKLKDILSHAYRNKKESLAFMIAFSSECNTQDLIWSLFILVSWLATYIGLWTIYTFSFILLIIATHLIWHYSDKYKNGILFTGTIGMSIVNIFRAFLTSAGNLFGIYFLSWILNNMINIPFDSTCYERARKTDMAQYIVFREIVINFGTFIFFMIASLIPDFRFLFIFAAIWWLFYLPFVSPSAALRTWLLEE